jgi:hypothetical protein
VKRLGSLREVTSPCPNLSQNLIIDLSLLTCSLPSWLYVLCSYMESKHRLHESPRPLGVSHPFMDHRAQMNRHSPSQTRCTQMNPMHRNEPVCLSTFVSLGTNVLQPWCDPHANMPQPFWCAPCLGKPLGMFVHPRCSLSQPV